MISCRAATNLVLVVVLSLVVECPREDDDEGNDEDEKVWLRPKAALCPYKSKHRPRGPSITKCGCLCRVYSAAERVPWGEPPMGWPAGSGRPAVR